MSIEYYWGSEVSIAHIYAPETETYHIIHDFRVKVVGGDLREGGGSLNTQYSIIDPWNLNPETGTYNIVHDFGVKAVGGYVREGGGVTQYSILNNGPL